MAEKALLGRQEPARSRRIVSLGKRDLMDRFSPHCCRSLATRMLRR